MTSDPFDAPPARGKNGGRPASAVERDQWDRPKLPDVPSPDVTAVPDMGTKTGRTSVSTLAGVLEDYFGLNRWKRGMTVAGIALDPALYARACSLDPSDKAQLRDLMNIAEEAESRVPEASRGRDHGTALHVFTGRINEGKPAGNVPEHLRADMDAYQRGLADHGLTVLATYCEKMIIVPGLGAYGAAGTFDSLVMHPSWKLPRIADTKSAQDLRRGMKETIQLAIYSRGAAIWNPHTMRYESMPEVDQELGVILGIPAESGIFQAWDVPLNEGWALARKAADIHECRKRQYITPMQPPRLAGLSWEDQIATATSRADLSRIRAAAIGAGAWTPELVALGLARLDVIENSVPVRA